MSFNSLHLPPLTLALVLLHDISSDCRVSQLWLFMASVFFKHWLSLGYTKSQPGFKDLGADCFLEVDPRKHLLKMWEKWDKEKRNSSNRKVAGCFTAVAGSLLGNPEKQQGNMPQNHLTGDEETGASSIIARPLGWRSLLATVNSPPPLDCSCCNLG